MDWNEYAKARDERRQIRMHHFRMAFVEFGLLIGAMVLVINLLVWALK